MRRVADELDWAAPPILGEGARKRPHLNHSVAILRNSAKRRSGSGKPARTVRRAESGFAQLFSKAALKLARVAAP